MLALTLKNLRSRPLRALLTAVAILLGSSMISASFTLKDQIERAFDDIFYSAQAKNDVVVSGKTLDFGFDPPFDQRTAERVAAVDGVSAVARKIDWLGQIVIDGVPVDSAGGAPPLLLTSLPSRFSPSTYTQGAPPRSGQVGVIEQTARTNDIKVGQKIAIATSDGAKPVTVSGIFRFASGASIGGATAVDATLGDIQSWFPAFKGKINFVNVQADDGVGAVALRDRIAKTLGPAYTVQTGAELAKKQSKEIGGLLGNIFGYGLLAFAGISVLVGVFIIFNTFSIIVAQRIRELGMLRTLGASRAQVLGGVVGEAFVIAVVASVVGVLLGLLLARGIGALLDSFNLGLPTANARLRPLGVGIGLAVGIVATLLAAVFPAVRAARIPPIAALREGATLPRSRFARFVPAFAGLIALLAAAVIAIGITSGGGTGDRLLVLGFGCALALIVVLLVARFITPTLSTAIGWPVAGTATGSIARDNAKRNPARTARTAAALMIGVTVVVFASSLVAAFKGTIDDTLNKSVRSEFILTPRNQANGSDGVPLKAIATLKAVPGIGAVSSVTSDDGTRFGRSGASGRLYGVDPATIAEAYNFEWIKGSRATLGQLGSDGLLLEQGKATSLKLAVGDSLTVRSRANQTAKLTVKGIYKDANFFNDGGIVPLALARRLSLNDGVGYVLANLAPGADAATVEARAGKALIRPFPTVKFESQAEFRQSIANQLNTLLNLIFALLGIAVVISIFGIVNTLLLSIYERTREIGMLRAIGTTRSQLSGTVVIESVITAVIGGILGVGLGLLAGWVVVKALESEGLAYSVPWFAIIAAPVGAGLVGIFAGLWPAFRTSRMKVLDALSYE